MEILSSFGYSTIFLGALKGALIGLVLGIIVVLICRKLGLFRRLNRAHQMLIRLVYLYLPLVFAGICGAWMAVSSVHSEVRGLSEQARPLITGYSIEVANIVLEELLSDQSPEGVSLAGLKTLLRKNVDQSLGKYLGRTPAGVQSLLQPVRGAIVEAISDSLGQRLFKQAGQGLNVTLSDADAARLWDKGIIQSLREGLVTDIIQGQIDQRFKPFYGTVRTFGILLLLPVLLEIVFFRMLSGRKARAAAQGRAG